MQAVKAAFYMVFIKFVCTKINWYLRINGRTFKNTTQKLK